MSKNHSSERLSDSHNVNRLATIIFYLAKHPNREKGDNQSSKENLPKMRIIFLAGCRDIAIYSDRNKIHQSIRVM